MKRVLQCRLSQMTPELRYKHAKSCNGNRSNARMTELLGLTRFKALTVMVNHAKGCVGLQRSMENKDR